MIQDEAEQPRVQKSLLKLFPVYNFWQSKGHLIVARKMMKVILK